MYKEKLQKIGLGKTQAEIYSFLITNGKKKGSEIAQKTGIARQLVYKVLDELIEENLVYKDGSQKVAFFETTHPSNLEQLLNKKEESVQQAKKELNLTIQNLISDFNLISGQPGVQVFEGEDGVKKVLQDSLTSSEEIYTFLDLDALNSTVKKLNDEYVKNRIKKTISKKILITDSLESRKLIKEYQKQYTEIRIIPKTLNVNFASAMEIYDNKIVYITFKNNLLTSTKIQDEEIYKMHRTIFEAFWKLSKEKTTQK